MVCGRVCAEKCTPPPSDDNGQPDLRAGAKYPYRTSTLAVFVAIPFHVGNEPFWRPQAWFTRRDRFALA